MGSLQVRDAIGKNEGYKRKYPAHQGSTVSRGSIVSQGSIAFQNSTKGDAFADISDRKEKGLLEDAAQEGGVHAANVTCAGKAVYVGKTAYMGKTVYLEKDAYMEKDTYMEKVTYMEKAAYVADDAGQTEDDLRGKESSEAELQAEGIADARELIRKRAEELLVKIQNGDTETYYPIGASFFTEKEWDKFLEKFDELEEEIRKLMREEHAKRAEKQEKQEREESQLLVSESTRCTYPASDPKEKDVLYIVCYTEDGIFCKKEGEEDCEWELAYDSPEQYGKVMDLVHQFSPEENLRFTAHENFWTDFLEDKIDIEDFLAFFQETKDGIPDYSITKGDSMYIDEAKAKYAPYMNPFGAHFYTAEEMLERQMAILEKNAEELRISYREIYQKIHPEYNGERIFCEYPGGPLYTADEIEKLMYRRILEAEGVLR